MDFLRMEGEANFLAYMPDDTRLKMFKSWYIGDKMVQKQNKYGMHRDTGVKYVSKYPKNEFIEKVVDGHILRSTGIKFDPVNYFRENQHPPKMPKTFSKLSDFEQAVRSLTAPGTDKNFWKTFDWFQTHFDQADPLQAGLYDLNRYYRKVW